MRYYKRLQLCISYGNNCNPWPRFWTKLVRSVGLHSGCYVQAHIHCIMGHMPDKIQAIPYCRFWEPWTFWHWQSGDGYDGRQVFESGTLALSGLGLDSCSSAWRYERPDLMILARPPSACTKILTLYQVFTKKSATCIKCSVHSLGRPEGHLQSHVRYSGTVICPDWWLSFKNLAYPAQMRTWTELAKSMAQLILMQLAALLPLILADVVNMPEPPVSQLL